MRFFWPEKAKPSKTAALQKDYMRPSLQHGYIEKREDEKLVLCVTNSWAMAEIPITQNGEDEVPDRSIPIPRRAMSAAERVRPIDIEIDEETGDVTMRDDDASTTYHLSEYVKDVEFKAPPFKDTMAQNAEREFTVALNPKLLLMLTEAMGLNPNFGTGVRLTFNLESSNRAIRVEPMNATDETRGLLMPIQLPEPGGYEDVGQGP